MVLGGVGWFGVSLMKALREQPPLPQATGSLLPAAAMGITASELVDLRAAWHASAQKSLRLEQALEARNIRIAALEKELGPKAGRIDEIEKIRDILQGQIAELREHNKKLKADMALALEENLDLQTRIFAGQTTVALQDTSLHTGVSSLEIHPEAFAGAYAGAINSDDKTG